MPRLPAKQREAEKVSTQLPGGSYAAAAHDTPPRHAFEAHALSLLSSLSGDRKKRKAVLDSFIAALKSKREEFRKEKKTGAGSATEAIEFYQFVLEKNSSWAGRTKQSAKLREDLKDNLDMSKQRCKVCNLGGDLFSCSQVVCQNSFHLKCVRPPLEKVPPEDWSCAWCDVDYVTGLKPQARKRRLSVSAVRAMEKVITDIESNKALSQPRCKGSNKRQIEEIDKVECENSPNRSQRQRRQTALYNAPRKINDEHPTGAELTPDITDRPAIQKEDIPETILKKLLPKNINSNSKHGQYHCRFCMDDEATETCCFCACRVCFSKRDRNSTILCDICDAEYHMDCLSPPLTKIPSSDWFCPTCVNVITSPQNDTKKAKKSPTAAKSPKASKGSAPKLVKPKITKASRNILKATYASKQPRLPCGRFAPKNFLSPNKQGKRGPGRPPKSASKPSPPKKNIGRGRGRPPASSKAVKKLEAAVEIDDDKLTVEMKNGPNPKPVSPKKTGRGRGRPPSISKTNKTEEKDVQCTADVNPKIPVSSGEAEQTSPNPVTEKATKETGDMEENGLGRMDPPSPNVVKQNVNEPRPTSVEDNVTLKKNESFVSDLSSRQGPKEKETISENDIKKAEAAAVKAVGNAVKVHVESKDGQKAQLSRSVPSTTVAHGISDRGGSGGSGHKVPRRKPGARECMQISRRFGANIIPQNYMETLLDYCTRGKVEHLIRMRERLDEHSRFLELQLAGLEMMIEEKGGQEPVSALAKGGKIQTATGLSQKKKTD